MRMISASININGAPSRITDAFLKENMLKEWWKVERCLVQPQSGGLYTLVWNISQQGFGYVATGIITLYQPGIMLNVEKVIYLNTQYSILGPMTLHIEIQQNEKDCTLNLTQDGYKDGSDWDWYYEAAKISWTQVLINLKSYLEKV